MILGCRAYILEESHRILKLKGVLLGKIEGKRQPGRRRLIWEVNIKMDLKEVG
jgi:hypothetical protein